MCPYSRLFVVRQPLFGVDSYVAVELNLEVATATLASGASR
jgi:hypothetical protein